MQKQGQEQQCLAAINAREKKQTHAHTHTHKEGQQSVCFSKQRHRAEKTWRKAKIQTQKMRPPPAKSTKDTRQNDGGNNKTNQPVWVVFLPFAKKAPRRGKTRQKEELFESSIEATPPRAKIKKQTTKPSSAHDSNAPNDTHIIHYARHKFP